MTKAWRILVVDDNHRITRTLVDILKLNGYRAEAAHSGAEALHRVKKVHFGCVLTDIKMAEMNGVDLVRAIKAMQAQLPVVLMTAYSTDKRVKEGLEEGAIAALTKPLDINALLSLLSGLRQEQRMVTADGEPPVHQAPGTYAAPARLRRD